MLRAFSFTAFSGKLSTQHARRNNANLAEVCLAHNNIEGKGPDVVLGITRLTCFTRLKLARCRQSIQLWCAAPASDSYKGFLRPLQWQAMCPRSSVC